MFNHQSAFYIAIRVLQNTSEGLTTVRCDHSLFHKITLPISTFTCCQEYYLPHPLAVTSPLGSFFFNLTWEESVFSRQKPAFEVGHLLDLSEFCLYHRYKLVHTSITPYTLSNGPCSNQQRLSIMNTLSLGIIKTISLIKVWMFPPRF